ncbi:MAG TPA: lysophospholipid acyltransferase family protein [Streptosporangiaceae bacterium]|nr:lysophospholipid acyltransferase family protein [Streptosporangiaceae bacterium]
MSTPAPAGAAGPANSASQAASARRPWGYSRSWRMLSVAVLRPSLRLLIRNRHSGRENIPKTGGVILAPNHVSYVDWGTDALFCYESGRYPVFLIKASMFGVPFIGQFLRKAGQLPVHRGRADAALVLKEAEAALEKGACVIIYPEATATRDPDLWPMVSKTGVARLALTSGAPVIPVAHWGTADILPYGSKKVFSGLFLPPRKTVRTVAGPAVDLSAWAGKETSARALREATAAIMGAVTGLVGELRGEQPPEIPYDPSTAAKTAPEGSG